jgi:hypothetical protein
MICHRSIASQALDSFWFRKLFEASHTKARQAAATIGTEFRGSFCFGVTFGANYAKIGVLQYFVVHKAVLTIPANLKVIVYFGAAFRASLHKMNYNGVITNIEI